MSLQVHTYPAPPIPRVSLCMFCIASLLATAANTSCRDRFFRSWGPPAKKVIIGIRGRGIHCLRSVRAQVCRWLVDSIAHRDVYSYFVGNLLVLVILFEEGGGRGLIVETYPNV